MTGTSDAAYAAALKMLARRELSEFQVRARLARRLFEPDAIDSAVTRLRRERLVDDRRTALACARTELHLRHRGRVRAIRRIESLGISRDVARQAAAEVFADIDEGALIEQLLDRRLHGGALDQSAMRRLYRYLIAQGFDTASVTTALHARVRQARHDD